jgi:hypothetical protein
MTIRSAVRAARPVFTHARTPQKMSAAPKPSQAGLREFMAETAKNRLFNPNQTRTPPSRMKMNSVIIRNNLFGLSMLASARSGIFDSHGFQFHSLLRFVIRSAR